ncbi:chorismate mutase [Antrihabitans sp. YC2-6]|uniref:chorismate mutase n=1 Tax=Antrihabitans sp. YC2-6 TaxID=2799498 RepID=UPI0018F49636|nr:chorismate mutase [Antrihabitans sp. YC2-6]MBJ8345959.1 chorismate mutase [Antrihabitans sp. YC2-6]
MPVALQAPLTANAAAGDDVNDDDLARLRAEIDRLDAEILDNVRRRVEITRRAGKARVGVGLPQATRHAEMDVLRTFEKHLGRDGVSLGMVLLRLGRTGVPGRQK